MRVLIWRSLLTFLLLGCAGWTRSMASYRVVSVTPILKALEVKHYELANGLQVAVVEDGTRPVVTCQINYRVGSADEPPKRQGLAHLVEHLLHDPVFLDELNLQSGRHSNASTSKDGTRYYTTIPKYLLPQVIDHFAKDMMTLDVTQEAFDIEKDVVLAEALSRSNHAEHLIYQNMNKHVFAGHPYQYPVIGTHQDSIRAFTREMAQEFHRRYYVPNNACLVIVGDVHALDVMPDVVRAFGKIPLGEPNMRQDMFTPAFTRVSQDTVVYHKDAREPTVWSVWPLPSTQHPDRKALSVLRKVLFGGNSSPINLAVRQKDLVLSSRSGFYMGKEGGALYFKATLAPHAAQDVVTWSLNKVIRSVVDSLSDRRMHVVRNLVRKDLYAMITSPPSLAGVLGYSFINTKDPTHRIRWMQELDGVTKADIQRVAQTYLIDQPVRQYVLTKTPDPSPPILSSGKILFLAAAIALVFLIVRYFRYKHTWQSLGILFCFLGTTASADIPNHKVYYQHDPRVPQTEISLIFATGGRTQEPIGKSGLLFALERLLYNQMRKTIGPHFDRLGAHIQFQVSDLDATIRIFVFSENLDETLLLVQDFLADLHFDDRELNQNREMILSVFKKYVDNNRFISVLRDRIFLQKEYRRVGTLQGINNVTAQDLNDYVAHTRHAKVLYFKVVSDLSEEQIQKSLAIFTANRLQDGFSPHPKPKRDPIFGRKGVIVPFVRSQVDHCYGITNALPREDGRWFAQALMVDALNQYWFYKLREQKGWCYTTQVSLKTRFFPPVIQFYANPAKNNTKHLVPEMYRLIQEFHEDPEFWKRLEKSRKRLKQAYFMAYGLGQVLNQQIEFDRDGILPVSVADYERAIDGVTREDVYVVIRELFNVQGVDVRGLQLVFFGEQKRLMESVKGILPQKKVVVLDTDVLKEDVDYTPLDAY